MEGYSRGLKKVAGTRLPRTLRGNYNVRARCEFAGAPRENTDRIIHAIAPIVSSVDDSIGVPLTSICGSVQRMHEEPWTMEVFPRREPVGFMSGAGIG